MPPGRAAQLFNADVALIRLIPRRPHFYGHDVFVRKVDGTLPGSVGVEAGFFARFREKEAHLRPQRCPRQRVVHGEGVVLDLPCGGVPGGLDVVFLLGLEVRPVGPLPVNCHQRNDHIHLAGGRKCVQVQGQILRSVAAAFNQQRDSRASHLDGKLAGAVGAIAQHRPPRCQPHRQCGRQRLVRGKILHHAHQPQASPRPDGQWLYY